MQLAVLIRLKVEQNNYQATLKVANACVKVGARLISCHLQAFMELRQIVSEDCSADELKPQSPYATTKLKEESLMQHLCSERGLRLFRAALALSSVPQLDEFSHRW